MKLLAALLACLIAFASAAPQFNPWNRGGMGMGMGMRPWSQPTRTVIIQKEIIRQPGFGGMGRMGGMGMGGMGGFNRWGK